MRTVTALLFALTLIAPSLSLAEAPPQYITQWNTACGGTGLHQPRWVDAGELGKLYVVEFSGRLMRYDASGQCQATTPSLYQGLAVSNGFVWSRRSGYPWIDRLDANLQFTGVFFDLRRVNQTYTSINVRGLAVSQGGDVFLVDGGTKKQIIRFNPDGTLWGAWPTLGTCADIDIGPSGDLYIINTAYSRVDRYTQGGVFVDSWDAASDPSGGFYSPQGIATDIAGSVYVADTDNNRIQKFTSTGEFLCEWGSQGFGAGEFQRPYDVASDELGNIFVPIRWPRGFRSSATFRPQLASPPGANLKPSIGNLAN